MNSDNGKAAVGIKSRKLLDAAMFSLLEKRNFIRINVSDICREASLSRATFYSHFLDKYDFLEYWLMLNLANTDEPAGYEKTATKTNAFIAKHKTEINNLITDADIETLGILFSCVLSTLGPPIEKNVGSKQVVLSNFYAGGMIYYLTWHVKNRFPLDIALMNAHLFEMIELLREWGLK